MAGIGGMLGTAGGASGTGFNAPSMAPTTNPLAPGQLAGANAGVGNSLQNQNALLAALQGQNGLQNQSQVYGQLQGVANGTGPNPAMAQLNQTTGQNVASEAALQAGQRGASSNVGLMARQIGQQGAATQQAAVGQGATLAANQELNALSAAGSMANTQASNQIGQTNANTSAQMGQQSNLLSALGNYNNTLTAGQGNVNSNNTTLANTQLQGQQAVVGGLMNSLGGAASSAGSSASSMGGAEGGEAGDDFGVEDPGVAAEAAPAVAGSSGGEDAGASALSKGFGSFGGSSSSSGGGSSGGSGGGMGSMVGLLAMMAGGGMAPDPQANPLAPQQAPQGPQSSFGQFVKKKQSGVGAAPAVAGASPQSGAGALFQGSSALASAGMGAAKGSGSQPQCSQAAQSDDTANQMDAPGTSGYDMNHSADNLAQGGRVKAVLSPGERYLSPKEAREVAAGKKDPLTTGEKIPGKPKYPGNDYRNDIVPKDLEAGGVVVPNAELQSKAPSRNSAEFVRKAIRGRR